MTLVWSWEEMEYVGEEEPRLLPDLYIEPDDVCAYCGLTEAASGKPLAVQCSQCGGVAHVPCAVDCAPWDSSEEYDDFVCGTCLKWTPEDAANHAASLAATEPTGNDCVDPWHLALFVVPVDDVDPFDCDEDFEFDEEEYPLP